MLSIANISKHFDGVKALSSVSLSAEQGRITGIIGPNGSGKSTLLNVLTNVLTKDAGTVRLEGKFARTFQDPRLWGHMTALDTVLLAIGPRGVRAAMFDVAPSVDGALAALAKVGLEEHARTQARHLSYGQRKLLELGAALAGDARILFLDEPFAGLFPEMIAAVKKILLAERARGTAIVLVEHDMSIIKELCDHVFVMDGGKNIAEGSAADVLANEAVKEAYLGD